MNNTNIDPKLLELAKQQVLQEQQQVSEQQRTAAIEAVVKQLPPEPIAWVTEFRNELAKVVIDENGNPFWPAITIITSVVNAIEALKLQLQQKPDAGANIKAFQDLLVGLETNQFYTTHKAQIWPVMNMVLQANLDAVQIAQGLHNAEFATPIDQVLIDRCMSISYEIVTAVLFCVGGMQGVRNTSVRLRRAFFKHESFLPVKLDQTNTEELPRPDGVAEGKVM
jgi:hypothetical protein